jgi:hypothetical protein
MGRLELGLGLEVLGFRAAPPLGETTKGEEIKVERLLFLLTCVFFVFLHRFVSCCSSALHLFLAITFVATCSSFCVAIVYYVHRSSPCNNVATYNGALFFVLCCYYLLWCITLILH